MNMFTEDRRTMVILSTLMIILTNIIVTAISYRGIIPEGRGYEVSSTELTSYYSEVPPSLDNANDDIWENIVNVIGAIPLHAPTGSTTVDIRSIYTDSDIYFRFTWRDLHKNDEGTYWIYHQGNWTFNSAYQDGFGVYFPVEDTNNYFKEEGCMRTCHAVDEEYMNPENQARKFTKTSSETGDIWYWSSSLTAPYNYAIDGYLTHVPSDNNVGYYIDEDEDFGLVKNRPLIDYKDYAHLGQPVFMQNPDIPPTLGEKYIKTGEEVPFDTNYYDPDTGYSNVNPITHEPWKNGDKVAGYMLDHPPTGDGDVSATASYSPFNQTWTLLLKRSLTTDDIEHDLQFDDLSAHYLFGISIFGDLTGTSGTRNWGENDAWDTRCIPSKTSETLILKFQPILSSKYVESVDFPNDPSGLNVSDIEKFIDNPVWDSSTTFNEPLHDVSDLNITDPNTVYSFNISTIYTNKELFLLISWDGRDDLVSRGVEIGWQTPSLIGLGSKYCSFFRTNDHINTNCPEGGDVWTTVINDTASIDKWADSKIENNKILSDESGSQQDIIGGHVTYGSDCYMVIKRNLETYYDDDIQFMDLTRVYLFSVLFQGLGGIEYSMSRTLTLRFEPDDSDTTPPSEIVQIDGKDGTDSNVFLSWNKCNSSDFGCYNIYHDTSMIDDISSIKPVLKVSSIEITEIEVTGLFPGRYHYFSVTPVDDNGNENRDIMVIKIMISDIIPPPLITGLKAESGTDSNVVLSWNRSEIPDFGHYNIYVASDPLKNVTGMMPEAEIDEVATSTYDIRGLRRDEKYYLAVTAVDHTGNENRSVYYVDAVPKDINPPSRVTGVNAFNLAMESGGELSVKWKNSSAADLDHYNVYMSPNPINATDMSYTGLSVYNTTDKNSIRISGLDDKKRYYFVVTAVDWYGHESMASICVYATPTKSGPPDPVTSFKVRDGKDGTVILSWEPSDSPYFHHYCLYLSETQITDLDSNGLILVANITSRNTISYYVTGLKNGTTYHFAITVANIYNIENKTVIVSDSATPTKTKPPAKNPLLKYLPYIITIVAFISLIMIAIESNKRIKRYGSLRKRRPRDK